MTTGSNLLDLELLEIADLIRDMKVSPVEVAENSIRAIEEHDPILSAFITTMADSALAAARAAEQMIAAGHYLGPLHGVPIAIKDIVNVAGVRATWGSRILADHVPSEDATVVARMRRDGAILVGKLNMHEFAFGVTTENPHYGTARNPWNLAHSAGGSSGGSGTAVAARLCYGALGTDTGCSVRLPASYCGISGLRPSIGRVSNHGVGTLAWTLDTVGPMARSAADCATMLSAMAGHDPRDSNSATVPRPTRYPIDRKLSGARLGLIRDYSLSGLQEDVASALDAALDSLESAGAIVKEVDIADLELATSALMTIDIAEPAAYHAEWLRERPEDYGSDVRTFLEQGEMYSATQYIQAQRYRSLLHRQFIEAFREVDVVITPTVPYVAPPIGESTVAIDGKSVGLIHAIMRYNALPPLCGLPALSIPCGFSRDGLPIGLQLIGNAFDEAAILGIGHNYQQLTDWHRRKPQISEAVA